MLENFSTDELTTSDEFYMISKYDDNHYIVQFHTNYFDLGFTIFICVFLAIILSNLLTGGGKN